MTNEHLPPSSSNTENTTAYEIGPLTVVELNGFWLKIKALSKAFPGADFTRVIDYLTDQARLRDQNVDMIKTKLPKAGEMLIVCGYPGYEKIAARDEGEFSRSYIFNHHNGGHEALLRNSAFTTTGDQWQLIHDLLVDSFREVHKRYGREMIAVFNSWADRYEEELTAGPIDPTVLLDELAMAEASSTLLSTQSDRDDVETVRDMARTLTELLFERKPTSGEIRQNKKFSDTAQAMEKFLTKFANPMFAHHLNQLSQSAHYQAPKLFIDLYRAAGLIERETESGDGWLVTTKGDEYLQLMRSRVAIFQPDYQAFLTDKGEAKLSIMDALDQIKALEFGGFESTATTVGWLLFFLAAHQEMQARIRAEFEAEMHQEYGRADFASSQEEQVLLRLLRDSSKLKFARAFVAEVLRVRPPLFDSREAQVDIISNGQLVIPKSQTVLFNFKGIQQDTRKFKHDPKEFYPDRFLEGESIDDLVTFLKKSSHACLGRSFVMQELVVIAALMVDRFAVVFAPGYSADKVKTKTQVTTKVQTKLEFISL